MFFVYGIKPILLIFKGSNEKIDLFQNKSSEFSKFIVKAKRFCNNGKGIVFVLENSYGYGRALATWLIEKGYFAKKEKIIIKNGLTSDKVEQIEKIYKIVFPKSLQDFLMTALPVSKGFYNWRNKEQDNIEYIKNMIIQPIKYISDMPEEIYWCEDWRKEPTDKDVFKKEVKRLEIAPKLIPIFSHRYMPMLSSANPPIISVHVVDIIYFGEDIRDYLEVEFGEKKQNMINFENINPITFWTDIM